MSNKYICIGDGIWQASQSVSQSEPTPSRAFQICYKGNLLSILFLNTPISHQLGSL